MCRTAWAMSDLDGEQIMAALPLAHGMEGKFDLLETLPAVVM